MTGPLFDYSVFGLAVSSAIALPGLHPPSGLGSPMRLDALRASDFPPPPGAPHCVGGFEAHWHVEDGRWLSRYGAGSGTPLWSMEAHSGGSRLDVRWSDPAQLHDIPAVVQGAGLAMALHLRGDFILHASAVAVAGRAILVIGNSGAGKSSTAAALVRAGCPLVSDDMAVLDVEGEGVAVRRGPLRMRVYEDSARAAGWAGPLPRLFRHPVFDDKRYIDVPGTLQAESAEVAAIFVLQPRDGGSGRVLIERLEPRAALAPLLRNIYRASFLDSDRSKLAAERCAWIASRIPVASVRRPESLEALPEIAGSITRFASALR
jgi:hypothetical protein